MGYPNAVNGFKIPVKTLKVFTDEVNGLVQSVVKNLQPFESLGPQYSLEHDTAKVASWLQSYRLTKKYCIPENKTDLTTSSVKAVLNYDSHGIEHFVPATMRMDPSTRRNLYKLREKLHENFSNFRLDFCNVVLPTGETVVAKRGDCSIYSKLADPKQWCVTPECFDYAVSVIYATSWLKRIAKSHMPRYTRADEARLFNAFGPGQGFEIFKCKLLDFITIVPGSRITTVPKNNDAERVINMEPMLNMICQLTLSQSLRSVLRQKYNFSMEDAQEIHRRVISDLNYATIDLSKASDSNWLAVIEFLYPKRLLRYLKAMRSPVGSFRNTEHVFNMLSPMGNGFTFEVMTITLLTAARLFDETASVFGDDIIIKSDVANPFIELISLLGYNLNESKTFTSGHFRESCGGFFHKDQYLESYDFWYCENAVDAVVTLNKLLRVYQHLNCKELVLQFVRHKVPLLLLKQGPGGIYSTYVEVPFGLIDVKRLKRRDKQWTGMTPMFKKKCKSAFSDYQYDHRSCDFYVEITLESNTYVTLKKFKRLPQDNVRNKALIGSYLYSGMCTAPTIRGSNYLKQSCLIVY